MKESNYDSKQIARIQAQNVRSVRFQTTEAGFCIITKGLTATSRTLPSFCALKQGIKKLPSGSWFIVN